MELSFKDNSILALSTILFSGAKRIKPIMHPTLRELFLRNDFKGSLTLAMGKCLWFSVKIKVCQSSLSSPLSYPDLGTLWQ